MKVRTRAAVFATVLLAGVSLVRAGQPFQRHPSLPSQVLPDGLGVNIHFTDPQPGEMEMMAAAGIRWVRMDFDWIPTEPRRGEYDFRRYDRLMSALERHGIRAIFILDYVHPLYDNAQSPHTEEARQAMARWAAAAAKHFAGKGILWEIYNEPNITPFWRPTVNVDHYAQLALAISRAIRAAAPGEAIIGPATSGLDFPFLEACFKAGLLQFWDAVSVHPYRQQNPETAAEEYRRLRALIAQYAPSGKRIPILSGEWGYSSAWSGYDEERQGKMLPRQWLFNQYQEVPLSIWYDWHDDGPDPKEPEHHFGTVLNPYHSGRDPVYDPKPAYRAAQTLTHQLGGFRYSKRLDVGNADDYVLLFDRENQVRVAAWSASRDARTVTIPASPGRFAAVDHLGEPRPDIVAGRDGIRIRLTDSPVYLAPEKPNDLLRVAAAWERAPLESYKEAPRLAVLPLALRNPLPNPIRPRMQNSRRALPHGRTATLLSFADLARSPEPVTVRHELSLAGMGAVRQKTLLFARNPLILTPMPVIGAQGKSESLLLPIRIENPSGEPFEGKLELHAKAGISPRSHQLAVSLAPGSGELMALFPVQLLSDRYAFGYRLLGSEGPPAAAVPRVEFERVGLPDLKAAADGDAAVRAELNLERAAAPPGLPHKNDDAWRLSYRFAPGWKFAQLLPASPAPIIDRPRALGVWIHGDGKGLVPRVRVTDSTGQTFQPDGGRIDWNGWRYVTFPLDGTHAGHWGGANDGVIRYPLRWEAPFLLDNVSRSNIEGQVHVTGWTLIY